MPRHHRPLVLLVAALSRSADGSPVADEYVVVSSDNSTRISISASTGIPTALQVSGCATAFEQDGSGLAVSVAGKAATVLGPVVVTTFDTSGGNEFDKHRHKHMRVSEDATVGVRIAQNATFGIGQTATLSQTFEPGPGSSIAWTVAIEGTTNGSAAPVMWTPAFDVTLATAQQDAETESRSMWIPWSEPQCSATAAGRSVRAAASPVVELTKN